MGKSIFLRLAKNNIIRNRRMYLPYFVASTVLIAVYFMVLMIINSRGIGNLSYSDTLLSTFKFCYQLITLIVVPFMLYINSFIMKERKKEFALYGILGLEKSHVSRVIIWESFFLNISSLILGILSGCVFGKVIFMVMIRAFGEIARGTVFNLPIEAFTGTILVFGAIFVVATIYNLCRVSLANPIDLLQGKAKGEKKVRFVIPLTLIGAAGMGWAYFTALTSEPGLSAINQFFVAAAVVIAATYFLFIAGSVFVLSFLRKRPGFYYKPENFITIGSLSHRMKQNAAGLATICILATMVMSTVAITTSIYLGQGEMVLENNPNDVEIITNAALSPETASQLESTAYSLAKDNKVEVDNYLSYNYLSDSKLWKNGELRVVDRDVITYEELDDVLALNIITVGDYNRVMGKNAVLNPDEIMVLTNYDLTGLEAIETESSVYNVVDMEKDTPFTRGKNSAEKRTAVIVAGDDAAAQALFRDLADKPTGEVEYFTRTVLDLEGGEQDCLNYTAALNEYVTNQEISQSYHDVYHTRQEGYGIFGGLLFVGVFFSLVFLTAAIVIIYFKQVSEGYEDKERFEILQKIGMSQKEVKSTINKQILLVFFLPLAVALIHMAVASRIIVNMLSAMNLTNTPLTLACIGVTVGVFALIYVVVYRLTAKTYYRLVKRN